MLGSPKPRRPNEPIAISLDDVVPKSNFYRHLEVKPDLATVRYQAEVGGIRRSDTERPDVTLFRRW